MANGKKLASGFVRIKLDHVEKILDMMVTEDHQTDIPLFFGPPGLGKTEVVEGWVKKRVEKGEDFSLHPIILSQHDPTELKGFPYVDDTGNFRFAPLHTFPVPKGKQKALIFFDELTTSNKEVQNVTLRLFSQKSLGDYDVPPNVFMAAAANHNQDVGVFVHKLSTAMKTRFATYHIEEDFESWKRWALDNDIEPSIIYFLQQHPDSLIQIDADKDSMPCPRTWANLSHQMRRMRAIGLTPEKNLKAFMPEVIARVGGEAGEKYQNYVEIYSKVDVDEIMIKGKLPDNIRTAPGDFGIMGACLGRLKDPKYPVDPKITANFINCLKSMKQEFAVCMIGDMLKTTPFPDRIRPFLKPGSEERKTYEGLLNQLTGMLEDKD